MAVRGVWNPQTEALLDARVVNNDAQSYASRSVTSVLDSIARAKKTKHCQACVERRADFTPFIVSTNGVIQREGQHFLKCLAARLAVKWLKPYSEGMHFIRVRLSISSSCRVHEMSLFCWIVMLYFFCHCILRPILVILLPIVLSFSAFNIHYTDGSTMPCYIHQVRCCLEKMSSTCSTQRGPAKKTLFV